MLVDLYVNYDCDLDAPNSFERMVICHLCPWTLPYIFLVLKQVHD